MNRILLSILLLITLLPALFGQTGGEGVFSFLKLTNSARDAALGGVQVALPDPDPGLLLQNPALLSTEMNNTLSVNYARYLAGIGFGNGTYAKNLGKYGMAALGIQFVDYGQFVGADETGLITGTFSAADYAFNLTYAKQFTELMTVGASVKAIYSHLENYRSYGIAADFGIVHQTTDRSTTIALCFKDLGTQLITYYEGGQRERLYCSLQLGVTHQLQHAPLRYSITAYDLNHWNNAVPHTDPNGISSQTAKKTPFIAVMRHIAIGAEIFPENKLTVRLGYNYRRANDLSLTDQTSFSGFSTGLGIKLPSIHINYALSGYSHSGLVHNFSLTTSLSRFNQK